MSRLEVIEAHRMTGGFSVGMHRGVFYADGGKRVWTGISFRLGFWRITLGRRY